MRALSLDAGLSDSTLHKYMTGGIQSLTVESLTKIAEALDLSLQDLMFGEPDALQPRTQEDLTAEQGSPRHHLRSWREARNMTQSEVAQRIGTDKGVISLLENGKRSLSEEWLRKFAEVYGTTPGAILDQNPIENTEAILSLWAAIPSARRAQAAAILRTFVDEEGGDGRS